MDFSKLKAMSGKKSLEALNTELSKISNQDSSKKGSDDRFWQPTVDKAGNGYAVIRFLPPPAEEDVPFVRIYDHGFQGPTGLWYIETSLTTIGKPDPVSEHNSKLWNSGLESDKEIVPNLILDIRKGKSDIVDKGSLWQKFYDIVFLIVS